MTLFQEVLTPIQKGDDQFPENAPAAISHGKGAYVWDVDGNKFLDCSMGLTSVSH